MTPTCPKCAYDMTGIEPGACPECGARWTPELLESRRTHQARAADIRSLRRVRLGMAALVVLWFGLMFPRRNPFQTNPLQDDLPIFFVLIIGWVACSCAGIWIARQPSRPKPRIIREVLLDALGMLGFILVSLEIGHPVFMLWIAVVLGKWGRWLGWPWLLSMFVGLSLFLLLLGGTVFAQALERTSQGFLFTDWDWPDKTPLRAPDALRMSLCCLGIGLACFSISGVLLAWHGRRTKRRIKQNGRN
jgi:hypothetical protein